jgi:hypothetical protein
MKKYKILDLQTGNYFSGGEIFNSKREACEQIISYHEIDCNISVEKKLLKAGKIDDCWNELSYFEWELEELLE